MSVDYNASGLFEGVEQNAVDPHIGQSTQGKPPEKDRTLTMEHTARLDRRVLDLADRLASSDGDEVRTALAAIRETWDGSHGEDQSPAEAFSTIAAYATEIAKILNTYEEG